MAAKVSTKDIRVHFEILTDPRRREPTYPRLNVVVMTLCAVISGADDFVAIAKWSGKNEAWLSRFLDLSAGIPSPDRFNAIFAAINPREFETCLLNWITSLHELTSGQVIAIDGKTLRRSYDAASSKSAIHMVSAWATLNQISLGQVVVDAKSNEITAMQEHSESRNYILTRYVSGKRFADAVCNHWGIENRLHWQLDVTFREDDCRVRKGDGDANLSVIRRFALSMLKNDKT